MSEKGNSKFSDVNVDIMVSKFSTAYKVRSGTRDMEDVGEENRSGTILALALEADIASAYSGSSKIIFETFDEERFN
jgi:hypothetical protein